jgi:hypothetical protein
MRAQKRDRPKEGGDKQESLRGNVWEEAIVNDSEMREALVRYLEESVDKIRVIDDGYWGLTS